MVLEKQELIDKIKGYIGADESDTAISLLEDVTDTITDFEDKTGEDWKKKYEENDAEWRKKYIERFSKTEEVEEEEEPEIPEEKKYTFEELFEEKEG